MGIMEHYKASLCMLMFQLQLSMAECDCQSQATAKHVHERHGVPYHDINLLPGTVRAKIDAMTAADMEPPGPLLQLCFCVLSALCWNEVLTPLQP